MRRLHGPTPVRYRAPIGSQQPVRRAEFRPAAPRGQHNGVRHWHGSLHTHRWCMPCPDSAPRHRGPPAVAYLGDRLGCRAPGPRQEGRPGRRRQRVRQSQARDLQYAERDATELAKVLARRRLRRPHAARFGCRGRRRDVGNVRPRWTCAERRRQAGHGPDRASPGHGQQMVVKDGARPTRRCRSSARRTPCPTDPATLVSLNAVLKPLDERGGGHNLLLVDACRNVVDPNKGARGGVNSTRFENLGEGTAVFFSCRAGRRTARLTRPAAATASSSTSSWRA